MSSSSSPGANSLGTTVSSDPSENPIVRVFEGATSALMIVLMLLVAPLLVVIPTAFGTTTQIRFPPVGFTWRWFTEVMTSADWDAEAESFETPPQRCQPFGHQPDQGKVVGQGTRLHAEFGIRPVVP